MPTEPSRHSPRSDTVPPLTLTPRDAHARRSGGRVPALVAGGALAATTAGVLAFAAAPADATPAAHVAPGLTAHPALMSEGTSGPAVVTVQQALHVRANGHFNHRTERAVVAFQRKHGLQVDGIVGPQTWDTLFHLSASASASTSTGAVAAGASTSTDGAASTSDAGSGSYTIPAGIVQCESGGDYSAVNPSSGAGGAYQILPSTWAAYGGQGLPQDASPAEQGEIAAKIYANQGPGAWTC